MGDEDVPTRSPAPVKPLAPLPSRKRLCPCEANVPEHSGPPAEAVLKANKVFATVTLPATRTIPPPLEEPAVLLTIVQFVTVIVPTL